jgi:RNA polymerase sigma-70 factor (ECF subfamily)
MSEDAKQLQPISSREDFENLALRYLAELQNAALRFVRNKKDAEDLVQETLLRALAGWNQFQPGTNCRAWLFRILTNNFIDEYRRTTKERDLHERGLIASVMHNDNSYQPDDFCMACQVEDEVMNALSALPEEFRQVVILADLHEMSYREVAQQLQCPLGTVMSRLYRARRILEEALTPYAEQKGIRRNSEMAWA